MDSKIAKADAKVQQLISQKRKKSVEDRKVSSEIFDKLTLETLYKLANQGYIDVLNGAISTGKEANVLTGITENKTFVACKVYRIATSDFKKMDYYVRGDPRFNIKSKNKRQLIYNWVLKEFKNLKRLRNVNVNVPKPIACLNNVLLLEFIGDEKGNPAPPVKNYVPKNPEFFFNKLKKELDLFINEANLIHGDLSNYNILNFNEQPVIIDVSQSVVKDNPISRELYNRDMKTLSQEYKKLGINTSYETLCDEIKFKR